jgi:polyhydroxyalkanoate synthase subunit PhaC
MTSKTARAAAPGAVIDAGTRRHAPVREERPQDDRLRRADRLIHASLGSLTGGMSPISLFQAWQDWAVHLAVSPGKQFQIQLKGLEKLSRLSLHLADCAQRGANARPCISPLPQDKRFAHPGWRQPPFSAFQQSFLLWQQWWHNATVGVPGVSTKHERLVEFYGRQWLDMMAPSNFLVTNPEAQERTWTTRGANLAAGLQNLFDDMQRAAAGERPAGTETFRPGEDVAVTPGDIVYRNELMELIRYRPTTDRVKSEPVLIVPAWIMKYYVLDLSPHNSLIRHLVDQGFEVFCISWRNPGPEHRDWGLDDYRLDGVMAALDVAAAGSPSSEVHGVGYCLGGTLLSIAGAAMARDGDTRLKSISLFAALVDFDEPGEIGLFIDEAQVAMLDDLMWSDGYLDQRRMAGAFQMLRSQDLLWSRMVRDYLLGERQPMNDLMAWNADATRMPYRMHSEYLHGLYLGNELALGQFRVDGAPVHLEAIRAPVFAVGTTSDHVAPWRSVFKVTHLFDSDIDFVLTNGGHNTGIVAPPDHPRRRFRHLHYRYGEVHPDPDGWLAATPEEDGSWWLAWFDWLARHSSGERVADRTAPPSTLGSAPGSYVLEP